MKYAWIIIALAAAYLAANLLWLWRSRRDNLPKRPPGGWQQRPGWDDDEDDDWPKRPPPDAGD